MAIEEREDIPEKREEMKAALRERFEHKGHETKHKTELLARGRKDGETLSQYVSELRRIGKLAYPRQDRQNREDFLKTCLCGAKGLMLFGSTPLPKKWAASRRPSRWLSAMRQECEISRWGGTFPNPR